MRIVELAAAASIQTGGGGGEREREGSQFASTCPSGERRGVLPALHSVHENGGRGGHRENGIKERPHSVRKPFSSR